MLKSLVLSSTVIVGAAVVACVACIAKKIINTTEEIEVTIEEEESDVTEVTNVIVTKENGNIFYECLKAFIKAVCIIALIITIINIIASFRIVIYSLNLLHLVF